jgi:uncharacterized protein DUF4333
MRLPILTITACAALALGACGGDDEEVTLPSTTIPTATGATGATGEGGAAGSGAAVEDALTDGGFGIQSVDCPDDVPLEEGDTFDCDFTIESGESGTLSITVDSADEQSATLSYQSDSPQVEGEGVDVEK